MQADMVACGDEFTLARVGDGSVLAWGSNQNGCLGETLTNFSYPLLVRVDVFSTAIIFFFPATASRPWSI